MSRVAACVSCRSLVVFLIGLGMNAVWTTSHTQAAEPKTYDVVVYGATAGGVIASIAAANEGMSVVLLEPRQWVGGMVTGGLGATDFGNKAVVGGMSRAFFERVGKHYGEPIAWYFEPHVADEVFHDWLKEAGVTVLLHHRVNRVQKAGRRIRVLETDNGASFSAKAFIDASYEGDLLPRTGISYTVGREGQSQYGETLAGRRARSKYHQFKEPVSPYDSNGKLLPFVYAGEPGQPGQGDKKVQGYNFRLCLTDRKNNQVPFPKPEGYDPHRYELLRRYLDKEGKTLTLKKIISIGRMPNDKTDINNNGAFSTDHIGGSWGYPEADYAGRKEIWDDHVRYVQGFFYFVANDPSVPKHLQDAMNLWGLAKDEFVDNNHWPHQLYIREARRMIGQYVMIQADLQSRRTKPDSIGMGSYNSDSHHVQRIPTADGAVVNEGDMQVPVQPYEIAYRALTPTSAECENLLVIACVSASHVAYSSIRMEPVYMIMGHSAGLAVAQAVRDGATVQNVDVPQLRKKLCKQGQILSLAEAKAMYYSIGSLDGIVVDNAEAKLEGAWRRSTSVPNYVGYDYLHDSNENKGKLSARFVPNLPAAGVYEVGISYTADPNRATNVPVVVHTVDDRKTFTVNQKKKPTKMPFFSLGRFQFDKGRGGYVEVSTTDTDGHVVVDAVQWLPASKE